MEQEAFDNFFRSYSKTVDSVDSVSAFWKLSDALILEIIRKEIGPFCSNNSVVLDAGGGTARWAVKIVNSLDVSVIVFDKSKDMLAEAQKNIDASKETDRISLVEGDITQMDSMQEESVDHIVSIYSPLSFIYEQGKAISELYRVLKKGGRILIMSHGYYNAIFSKINNYHTDINQLQKLEGKRVVKWAEHVPELITHSKESIEELLSNAGFNPIRTYGVPVFVQPGPEDFDPKNSKISDISRYLEDPTVFMRILDIEMEHNHKPTVCNRGMNIFALAEKA